MAKISLKYEVVDGDNCVHVCNGMHISPACSYLYNGWCMILGAKPSVITQGNTIIHKKLCACKAAEIKEEKKD